MFTGDLGPCGPHNYFCCGAMALDGSAGHHVECPMNVCVILLHIALYMHFIKHVVQLALVLTQDFVSTEAPILERLELRRLWLSI